MKERILLIAIFFLATLAPVSVVQGIARDQQVVDLTFHVLDSEKNLVESCPITLYHLSDVGLVRLAEATVVKGSSVQVRIPRIYKSTVLDSGKKLAIYAAVNLLVIAVQGDEVGSETFSVDPTYLDWPVGSQSVVVQMEKLPINQPTSANGASISQSARQRQFMFGRPPTPPYGPINTLKMTTVLEFTTWGQIFASSDWPVGAKIVVQPKYRYFAISTGQLLSDWLTSGGAIITLDIGKSYAERTGQTKWTLKMQFLYTYQTIVAAPDVGMEIISPADRANDPSDQEFLSASWTGTLPSSYVLYTWTTSPDTSHLPVTGGSNYIWSVGVGFSIGPPWNWAVSVTLSVTKQPAPAATLHIRAGSPPAGGYKVLTVELDGTWRQTYSNWRIP